MNRFYFINWKIFGLNEASPIENYEESEINIRKENKLINIDGRIEEVPSDSCSGLAQNIWEISTCWGIIVVLFFLDNREPTWVMKWVLPSVGSVHSVSLMWSSSTSCQPSLYHFLYQRISQSHTKGLPKCTNMQLLRELKLYYCEYPGASECPALAPSDCRTGWTTRYSRVSATPKSEDLQMSHLGFCWYWKWKS